MVLSVTTDSTLKNIHILIENVRGNRVKKLNGLERSMALFNCVYALAKAQRENEHVDKDFEANLLDKFDTVVDNSKDIDMTYIVRNNLVALKTILLWFKENSSLKIC